MKIDLRKAEEEKWRKYQQQGATEKNNESSCTAEWRLTSFNSTKGRREEEQDALARKKAFDCSCGQSYINVLASAINKIQFASS